MVRAGAFVVAAGPRLLTEQGKLDDDGTGPDRTGYICLQASRFPSNHSPPAVYYASDDLKPVGFYPEAPFVRPRFWRYF
ncbi:hypothetical protein R1flu_019595 [Riccia fluitans]|uniref:Uncharacterized protein n=1 Tax=Riccia fluitans TaxID=41844 RepID=A0ABD1ZJ31_9MARC